MGKSAVIGSVIAGILGVIILVLTIQDWQADEAHFSAEKQRLNAELNLATNNLVSACLSSLPAGDPQCDDLRQTVAESCELADNKLDACKDGRVDQYYDAIGANPAGVESQPVSTSQSTAEEERLLADLDKASIPSEELIEACSTDGVVNGLYESAAARCDYAMDIMTMQYCQTSPPTQYTHTLCRDARYLKYYGIAVKTENLPDPGEVSHMNEVIGISGVDFRGTNVMFFNFAEAAVGAVLNVTNHNSYSVELGKANFFIIDERGNIWRNPYVHTNNYFSTPVPDSSDVTPITIPARTSSALHVDSSTTYYDNNILKIEYAGQTAYILLKK